MRKFTLILALVLAVLTILSPAWAGTSRHTVLILAPGIEDFGDAVFSSMSYSSQMTWWDVDTFERRSGRAFNPVGFLPRYGYSKDMDFSSLVPDPYGALMSILTGDKFRAGQDVTDKTVFETLYDKGWNVVVTSDLMKALDALITFAEGDNGNPLSPGLFVFVLFEGCDAGVLASGVRGILDFVDSRDILMKLKEEGIGEVRLFDVGWQNASVIVTQGWRYGSGEPVPVFAEGRMVSDLKERTGAWYTGLIDNTQVYEAMRGSMFLFSWPKLKPTLSRIGSVTPITGPSLMHWLLYR